MATTIFHTAQAKASGRRGGRRESGTDGPLTVVAAAAVPAQASLLG